MNPFNFAAFQEREPEAGRVREGFLLGLRPSFGLRALQVNFMKACMLSASQSAESLMHLGMMRHLPESIFAYVARFVPTAKMGQLNRRAYGIVSRTFNNEVFRPLLTEYNKHPLLRQNRSMEDIPPKAAVQRMASEIFRLGRKLGMDKLSIDYDPNNLESILRGAIEVVAQQSGRNFYTPILITLTDFAKTTGSLGLLQAMYKAHLPLSAEDIEEILQSTLQTGDTDQISMVLTRPSPQKLTNMLIALAAEGDEEKINNILTSSTFSKRKIGILAYFVGTNKHLELAMIIKKLPIAPIDKARLIALACLFGHLEIAKILHELGDPLSPRDRTLALVALFEPCLSEEGWDPAQAQEGLGEMVSILLKEGPVYDVYQSSLVEGVETRQSLLKRILLTFDSGCPKIAALIRENITQIGDPIDFASLNEGIRNDCQATLQAEKEAEADVDKVEDPDW